jgi:hypothetical protein
VNPGTRSLCAWIVRVSGALWFCVYFVIAVAARGEAATCDQSASFYEHEGYTVNSLRISTGLAWLPAVQRSLEPILQAVPLKQRQLAPGGEVVDPGRFTAAAYFEGEQVIEKSFPELQASPQLRFAGRLSRPSLQNCDATKKTIDVVYRVYTLGLPTFNTLVFEGQPRSLSSAVPANQSTALLSKVQIQPQIGYNAARKTFGGTSVSGRFQNPVVQNASGEILGSSQSLTADAEVSGSHENLHSQLANVEWKLRYIHSDLPLAENASSQNVMTGQMLLGTAPRTARELIFRFGGALEGGNKQTNFAPGAVATTDLASSAYGATKAFVGSSFRIGRHSFKQSYGVKLGGAGARLDFAKQLVDVEQRLRFYPASHRALTIDTAATFGRIDIFGQLPVSERFFGGNTEQNFTANDSWVIRSTPTMRSFAENQFLFRSPAGVTMGDRFFSANATVAFNVWRYPLVPSEIENDRDFRSKLDTIVSGAEAVLTSEYIADTDEFKKTAEQLPMLAELMVRVNEQLKQFQKSEDTSIVDALDEAFSAAKHVDEKLAKSVQDNNDGNLSIADIQALAGMEPEEAGAEPDLSYLLDLASAIDDLKAAMSDSDAGAGQLGMLGQQVRDAEATLYRTFVTAVHSSSAKKAEERAKRDMVYSRRVVGEVFDTANLVAVSPVVMFDAGQIWESRQGGTGIRYGLGPGIKVSLFALDFTAGYSWNVHRRPGEGGGAFVVNLVVADIFK